MRLMGRSGRTLVVIAAAGALAGCKKSAEAPQVVDDAGAGGASATGPRVVPQEVGPVDGAGDPLPPGAVARLGSVRFLDRGLETMVFAGDAGKELVSSAVKGYAIWDAATGRRLAELRQDDPGPALAVSPDGKLLATGVAGRGKAQLWDLAGRKALGDVSLGREVDALCFADDGTLVAGGDGIVASFAADGKELGRFDVPARDLAALGCAAGQIAFGDEAGRVSSLALGATAPVALGAAEKRITAIALSADGARVAAGAADGNIHVWTPATPGPAVVIQAHDRTVGSLGWAGDVLWSSGGDAWIRSWSADGALIKEYEAIPGLSVQYLALTRDGGRAATWAPHRGPKGSEAGRFWLWDLATGDPVSEPERHAASLTSIAFAPDGKHAATASEDSSVRVWEIPGGAPAAVLTAPEGIINGIRFAHAGGALYAAGADAYLYSWDWKADRVEKVVGPIGGEVNAFALTPDDARLITGDEIGRVWSWDIAARARLQAHDRRAYASITGVAVGPDNRRLAISGSERMILVVDLTSGAEVARLAPDVVSSFAVAFSPDGKLLATAGDDGRVRLWDTTSWTQARALEGHDGSVRAVAFSADGARLLSGGSDATARLWQVADGTTLATFVGHDGAVTGVALSADGTLAGTASQDRTALLWKVP